MRPLQQLEKAMQMTPLCKSSQKEGQAHLAMGNPESALADTAAALKIDSKSVLALALRANAYYIMTEHEMAVRHHREALRLIRSIRR